MKNIHLLPTDKPSRLAGSEYITNEQGIDKRAFKLKLWNKIISNKDLRDVGYIPQNIYITNDEEIKGGDWIEKNGKIYKCTISNDFYITVYEKNKYAGSFDTDTCKKIILTTDPDLIKDGVQAIDDEFFRWFVKNPSCEFIKVEPCEFLADKVIYEIIIPQETLEDAAERIYDDNLFDYEKYRDGFKEGSKWQAQRMYSEEEVKHIVSEALQSALVTIYLEQWFKQFKKK
jgi:hypothetical protein